MSDYDDAVHSYFYEHIKRIKTEIHLGYGYKYREHGINGGTCPKQKQKQNRRQRTKEKKKKRN
jgi:hypothetical protein